MLDEFALASLTQPPSIPQLPSRAATSTERPSSLPKPHLMWWPPPPLWLPPLASHRRLRRLHPWRSLSMAATRLPSLPPCPLYALCLCLPVPHTLDLTTTHLTLVPLLLLLLCAPQASGGTVDPGSLSSGNANAAANAVNQGVQVSLAASLPVGCGFQRLLVEHTLTPTVAPCALCRAQ